MKRKKRPRRLIRRYAIGYWAPLEVVDKHYLLRVLNNSGHIMKITVEYYKP